MSLPRLLRPLTRHPRPLQQCLSKNPYHSYDHPPPPPYPPTQSSILTAALHRVPDHGFTDKSLILGAQDVGFLPISTNLFPRGVFELIVFWLGRERGVLAGRVHGDAGGLRRVWDDMGLGVGGRVRGLVLERLRANGREGVVGRWQEALAIMAQPSYVPASTSELWRLADEIWFLAGDVSVDTSWYTKRASLSAIYAATEVFQTQDQSTDFRDTETFLDSRLAELRTFGMASSAVGEWMGYTGHSVVNVLRSKGVRI
ncbi:hypothetical protein EG328_004975 [Venturia inaequalis]|uniref:Ubiquinone biosynthesis protein n=1 Tax=Venturia inaequalis TaxID=5025 RepID=A0A8H3YT39_VENIN|nr:hypothetical protein EG328_004975 [Venturia inaequalis]KAE9991178.1 hypothetical protein EG327_000360 [Venturia inaequalis]